MNKKIIIDLEKRYNAAAIQKIIDKNKLNSRIDVYKDKEILLLSEVEENFFELDKLDIEYDYDYLYINCECNKLLLSNNCYDMDIFYIFDGYVLCLECIKKDIFSFLEKIENDYISDNLTNEYITTNELVENGYIELEKYRLLAYTAAYRKKDIYLALYKKYNSIIFYTDYNFEGYRYIFKVFVK